MTVMRYTVLRTMLFFGTLLVFFLVRFATGIPVVAVVVLATMSSLALSLVLLKGPREQMAMRLSERMANRLPPEPEEGSDEEVEDALDEASRSAAPTPADDYAGDPVVAAQWDRRYADRQQLWSGQPNGALVTEVAGLPVGRVLDVGCGEGADAVWLARGGWDVTALEVSGVALERAARHAREAGVTVRWMHAGLVEAGFAAGSFDLVSAQYPALLRTPDASAERALLAAVAPGGVLLLVHHAGMGAGDQHDGHEGHDGPDAADGPESDPDKEFDPADYVWPSMVTALFDDDWQVEVDEQRPRVIPEGGAGAHHSEDLVVRARRLR